MYFSKFLLDITTSPRIAPVNGFPAISKYLFKLSQIRTALFVTSKPVCPSPLVSALSNLPFTKYKTIVEPSSFDDRLYLVFPDKSNSLV